MQPLSSESERKEFNQNHFGFRCLRPSNDSWAGWIIQKVENNEMRPYVGALPVFFAAIGDAIRSVKHLPNYHRWSNETKKNYLYNLIATISLFAQAPFMFLYKTPHLDRISLFCRERADFESQITACDSWHDQVQLSCQLRELERTNPDQHSRLIHVNCNPTSSLVLAIKSGRFIVADYIMKAGGHIHRDNLAGYCHAWNAAVQYCRHYGSYLPYENFIKKIIPELLGDLSVNDYIHRQGQPQEIDTEIEIERKESLESGDIEILKNFELPACRLSILSEETRPILTHLNTRTEFVYRKKYNNLKILDCSLLNFFVINRQIHNLKILINFGMDLNTPDKYNYTPLDSAFYYCRYNPKLKKIENSSEILEIAIFLISNQANFSNEKLFNPDDLIDSKLTDYLQVWEDRNHYTLSIMDEFREKVKSNPFYRLLLSNVLNEERVAEFNFWRSNSELLRDAYMKSFYNYRSAIIAHTRLPNVLGNLIAQYMFVGCG